MTSSTRRCSAPSANAIAEHPPLLFLGAGADACAGVGAGVGVGVDAGAGADDGAIDSARVGAHRRSDLSELLLLDLPELLLLFGVGAGVGVDPGAIDSTRVVGPGAIDTGSRVGARGRAGASADGVAGDIGDDALSEVLLLGLPELLLLLAGVGAGAGACADAGGPDAIDTGSRVGARGRAAAPADGVAGDIGDDALPEVLLRGPPGLLLLLVGVSVGASAGASACADAGAIDM